MGDSEIIALNRKKLEQGDPMMNIVLRDNDVVQVPTLEVGEFYVMGEISRPGVYSLTGREVTVKMAVAAAGGFGPLSWPENTILIRRVADNSEQIVPLDLQAIFQGERPDIMLKPNDVIAIGSDVRAPFYAVIRNAFRMTYGFGVIYDRNVAFPLRSTTSRRFTRW
jgi:protein involved in polysaccharide export with SLBB domain